MKRTNKLLSGILISLACIFVLINFIPPTDAIAINSFMNTDNKVNVAFDSGSCSNLPPNTMIAFNTAVSYGTMTFSLDVVKTMDDVLIVTDSDDLSVYTNSEGKISEKNYDEIKDLNFAYNYTDDGTTYPYRAQRHSCVKLEDLISSYPYAEYIINIVQTGENGKKTATLLSEIIRKNNLSINCVIRADEDTIDIIRNDDNIHVLTEPYKNETGLYFLLHKAHISNLCFKINYQFIEIPIENLASYSKSALEGLQKRNVAIYVSGVDSEEKLDEALSYNINGVITSDSKLITELLSTKTENTPDNDSTDMTNNNQTTQPEEENNNVL